MYHSKSLPDFEEYLPSVMILSLVGVRCIVVNQLPSNTCALSIIQGMFFTSVAGASRELVQYFSPLFHTSDCEYEISD